MPSVEVVVETTARAASPAEISRTAAALISKAEALGWTTTATYAAKVVDSKAGPRLVTSVLIWMHKPGTSTTATAMWVDGKFDSARRWAPEQGCYTLAVGARALAPFLEAVEAGTVEPDSGTVEHPNLPAKDAEPVCARCQHYHHGTGACVVILNGIPLSQGGRLCPCSRFVKET